MSSDPERVTIKGKPLICHQCGTDTFVTRSATIHGATASFFGVEWASPTAACHVCAECGFVHWFADT
ncbi:MAG: hypothetical protein ABI969_08570 [bacterium]